MPKDRLRAKIGFHELGIAGVLKAYRLEVPLTNASIDGKTSR